MSCAVHDRLRVAGSSAWVDPRKGVSSMASTVMNAYKNVKRNDLPRCECPRKGDPERILVEPSRPVVVATTHPLLLPSDATAKQLTAEPQTTNHSVRRRASTACPSGPRGLDDVAARTQRRPRGICSHTPSSVRRRSLGESSVAEGNRTGWITRAAPQPRKFSGLDPASG
jgi:hypothetical protein